MALKHFVKDTYKSIGEALLDIRKELQRLQPVDSGSIAWEQTETGMSAHIGDGSMGGSMPTEASSDEGAAIISGVSEYNSYFKLVDMTEYNEDGTVKAYKVGVVDGATYNADTAVSGPSYCVINGIRKEVPLTAIPIEESMVIWLKYDVPSETPYIIASAQQSGSYTTQLGSVIIQDDKTLRIVQRYTNGVLYATPYPYNGYFTVVWANKEHSEVKVVNGGAYADSTCGVTDIGYVKSQTMPPHAKIYLIAERNQEDNAYVFRFAESVTYQDAYVLIAEIQQDYIHQVWTGGTIYWGERYYI